MLLQKTPITTMMMIVMMMMMMMTIIIIIIIMGYSLERVTRTGSAYSDIL